MCYKAAMKAAILLFLLASPAVACDWHVTEQVDPMTDLKRCIISSPTVKLGVGVKGDSVSFVSSSPLHYDYLTVRVDDLPAIQLSDRARSTNAFEPDARLLLGQIRSGQRIRVQYRDISGHVNGDGEVCNLPALIDACAK